MADVPRDCEHGSLRRACPICERDAEIAELHEAIRRTYESAQRQAETIKRLREALENIISVDVPLGVSKPMPFSALAEVQLIAARALNGEHSAPETKPRQSLCKHDWVGDDRCAYCAREDADAEIMELRGALLMLYDKWENGAPCYEEPEEQSGYFGHAFNLTEQEENRVLTLLPEGYPYQPEAVAPMMRETDGWRPIETAPKDHCIDLWLGDRRMTRCYWDEICSEWRTTGNGNVLICFKKATHWMEIPAPPGSPLNGRGEHV